MTIRAVLLGLVSAVVLCAATGWGCSDRAGVDEAGQDSFVDGPVIYDFVASFPAAECSMLRVDGGAVHCSCRCLDRYVALIANT